MITNKNKTIFDDVNAYHIEKGYIQKFKENIKHFLINKDNSTTNLVNDHKIPNFKFVVDYELNNFLVILILVYQVTQNINIIF